MYFIGVKGMHEAALPSDATSNVDCLLYATDVLTLAGAYYYMFWNKFHSLQYPTLEYGLPVKSILHARFARPYVCIYFSI